jgi:uncharacterized membrane protein YeaQ/YmgE (transglycosylase-associated protein family)
MNYVWIAIVGLCAAAIAKLILPGRNGPRGVIGTTLVGVAGAYVGSFIGQFLGFYQPGEFAGFFGSIVGAIVIMLIWDLIFKKKALPPPVAK